MGESGGGDGRVAGTVAGGQADAEIGFAIGSLFPGARTAIGSGVGGAAGVIGGGLHGN